MPDLAKHLDTIEDILIELQAVQSNADSQLYREDLERLIERTYDLQLYIEMENDDD